MGTEAKSGYHSEWAKGIWCLRGLAVWDSGGNIPKVNQSEQGGVHHPWWWVGQNPERPSVPLYLKRISRGLWKEVGLDPRPVTKSRNPGGFEDEFENPLQLLWKGKGTGFWQWDHQAWKGEDPYPTRLDRRCLTSSQFMWVHHNQWRSWRLQSPQFHRAVQGQWVLKGCHPITLRLFRTVSVGDLPISCWWMKE